MATLQGETNVMSDSDLRTLRDKLCGGWGRRLLLAIPLGLAISFLTFVVLNYNGYCFKEGRFLPREEKYRMVVERMVAGRWPFWPVRRDGVALPLATDSPLISHWTIDGDKDPVQPIFIYHSADEFFARNPNCCEMGTYVSTSEGPFEPGFWDRAFGSCSGGIVRVTGIVRFRDQMGREREIQRTSESLLSNCGGELSVPTLK